MPQPMSIYVPNTLCTKYSKNENQTLSHSIQVRSQQDIVHAQPPPPPEHPKPPPYILKDPTHFPIHIILNDYLGTNKDKYKITKTIHGLPMPMVTPRRNI
jgi:hypothetical protein